MLFGLGLVGLVGLAGLRGPEVRGPSGGLVAWGGGGFGVTLGGFDLGVGSGLDSSQEGTVGWTSDLATGN